jgi:hypothetical protein
VSKWETLANNSKQVTRCIPAAQDKQWSREDGLLWPPLSLRTQLCKGWTSQMFLIEFKSNDNPGTAISLPMSLQICQQNGACSLQRCPLHMKRNARLSPGSVTHHIMKTWWSRDTAPFILTLGVTWSASCPGHSAQGKGPSIHWIEGQVGLRADLDEIAKNYTSAPTRNWTHILHFRA